MRTFLLSLLFTLFIVSCTTTHFVGGPISIMEVCTEQYFTQKQIDSLTTSDTLPNLGMWMDLSLQEFETREKIRKKFCVKGSNVYIALVKNDSIFITKRIGQ